jgi:hypothetical protein
MLFKELSEQVIDIEPKSKIELDAGPGVLLVPTNKNQRVFIYWTNEKEKIIASHTLKTSTIVTKRIQLSNPEDTAVSVIKLDLPNQNG